MLDNFERGDRFARAAFGVRCTGVGGRRLFSFSTSHQLYGICVDAVPHAWLVRYTESANWVVRTAGFGAVRSGFYLLRAHYVVRARRINSRLRDVMETTGWSIHFSRRANGRWWSGIWFGCFAS